MNFPRNLKSPYLLALPAALALLLALALTAPTASAGGNSGGVGLESGSGGSGPEGSKKAKYKRLWNKTSRRDKRWARRTSACESGGNPKAIGGDGRYRGAFQFMKATWRAAPKSPGGDPVRFNYKTQAVVAVALKRKDGAHHWPHCG